MSTGLEELGRRALANVGRVKGPPAIISRRALARGSIRVATTEPQASAWRLIYRALSLA